MRTTVLIAHNLRSCHNVGSLLRTADGLGVAHVYFTGYTPYPAAPHDDRLPHQVRKLEAQIHKTALGAEHTVSWTHAEDILPLLITLKNEGYIIAALEQQTGSISLPNFRTGAQPIALIVGREVEGIEPEVRAASTICLEIPMSGAKESFNVAVAAAMALYHLRFVGPAR